MKTIVNRYQSIQRIPASRVIARIGGILLAGLMLAGCGQDMTDLENYIADIKARRNAKLEPVPVIKSYEAPSYAGLQYRNPFQPVASFVPQETASGDKPTATQGPRPIASRAKGPLEQFPLDGLRMVGTLDIRGARYALVKSNETKPSVYRAKVGNYVGRNHGKIVQITGNAIYLRELHPDGLGGYIEQPATLALSE